MERMGRPSMQDVINKYLDKLRESGVTNMFGAAPYVSRTFGISNDEANRYLKIWMETFSERHLTR